MNALRRIALTFPEAEEGIACAGTALECATFKARNKAFLFIGATEARVKLGDSLHEAAALEAKEPGRYQVGGHGWVKVTFADKPIALDVMKRWIDESYRLLAPKQLVALLAASENVEGASKKKAKKQTRR